MGRYLAFNLRTISVKWGCTAIKSPFRINLGLKAAAVVAAAWRVFSVENRGSIESPLLFVLFRWIYNSLPVASIIG